jgi:serine/threonine protein kinase
MSPEQARGEPVDARSDLFSLGSVMYAICTGRPPFRAESSYGILRRITDTEPRPIREINSEIPDWLCQIVEQLHSKGPGERFQSAEEVAELLSRWLAHVQQPVSMPADGNPNGAPVIGYAEEPAPKQRFAPTDTKPRR